MNISRVTVLLFLFISTCSTSQCSRNDRGGPSLKLESNHIRLNRRIALTEYLIPPPLPKSHPVRAGRLANPSPAESPGYISRFMNWINPFKFGFSSGESSKSPAFLEAQHPPPPQPYGSPSFNIHPPLPPAPPFNPPLARPTILPFYPPLGTPPGPNSDPHPGPPTPLLHGNPLGVHPGPPRNLSPGPALNPPPSPPLHHYNGPPGPLHSLNHRLLPQSNNHGGYASPNKKGKSCNPCNKVPWVPMQGNAPVPGDYPPSPLISNGYLPPSHPGNHGIQHAPPNDFKIPEQSNQHSSNNPFSGPIVHPGPVDPHYNAGPFDLAPQSSHRETVNQFDHPPLPVIPLGQDPKNRETHNELYNFLGGDDLTSSGTQVNQGQVSVVSHEERINKESIDHKGIGGSLLTTRQLDHGSTFDRGYRNPSISEQNRGSFYQSIRSGQTSDANLEPVNSGNHNFVSQSGNEYADSFNSNTGEGTGVNYISPSSDPSINFGASSFSNHNVDNLNYHYSDDSSPSDSIVKDSRVTTRPPFGSSPPTIEGQVHFEESPLLDLTKRGGGKPASTDAHADTDQLTDDRAKTNTNYSIGNKYSGDLNLIEPTESYRSPVIQAFNGGLRPSISSITDVSDTEKNQRIEASTVGSQYTREQDASHNFSSKVAGISWSNLLLDTLNSRNDSLNNRQSLSRFAERNNSFEWKNPGQEDNGDLVNDVKETLQRQQNTKRNKQVQIIIPYTSDYTPIPFQQSQKEWSLKTKLDEASARRVPSRSELNSDNYIQQESRNDIRLINQLESQHEADQSTKSISESVKPPLIKAEEAKAAKVNNSIDVRRLQKNIDNWTIQEYSKPTPSSTVLPSSSHPYLLPSKKIPAEYLTTTGPDDRTSESKDHNESVKTYSLAGFSFNEVEHEGSASNRIEETKVPVNVILADSSKTSSSHLQGINKALTGEKSAWETHSVSISPANKERVYVVTPQSVKSSSKKDFEAQKVGGRKGNPQETNGTIVENLNKSKNNLSEFEAIEKAYQVLPQAVNNLAVASTGKENIPLWGIMEHEEFASLNLEENDEAAEGVADGPVLYTGHSKVSRAKR